MSTVQTVHKEHNMQEHLVGISILLAFLLPHTNTLFLLVNPLLCLLLVSRFKKSRKWQPFVFIVLVPIFLSILFNFQNASVKAFQSTFVIFLYFACFPFVGKVQVRNTYLYVCLAYIFISQIVYLLGIPGLTAFFDRLYPITDELMQHKYDNIQSNIGYGTMLDFRLGGIYHNSNHCSKYLTMLMAFFLSLNYSKKSKEVIYFILIAYGGILLTGSRTGFVVGSLIVYLGFIRNNKISGWIRYLIWGIAIGGILYILQTGNSLRGLNIEEGLEGSANMKWETFLYYLQTENSLVAYLFGHLDTSLFQGGIGDVMNAFDSEYGSMTFRFGFVGVIGILLFYWNVAKRIPKSQWFYFIILLWMISSTIVAAYRSLFVFMLLTSVIYSNNLLHNNKKTYYPPITDSNK